MSSEEGLTYFLIRQSVGDTQHNTAHFSLSPKSYTKAVSRLTIRSKAEFPSFSHTKFTYSSLLGLSALLEEPCFFDANEIVPLQLHTKL